MADYENHPTPRGATQREQGIIARMYRATGLGQDLGPALAEGLALIVELIEARNKRRDFEDYYDRPQDGD